MSLLLVAVLLAAPEEMTAVAPGALEGRPEAARQSPVQVRVDAAPAGATIVIEAGVYRGDLVVERPMRLVGEGRPRLVGSGSGSVVRVRADGVTLEGFDIDGVAGGDLGRDSSGVHVAARRAVVRDCVIENALFGVYLREADGAVIERNTIRGIPGRDPGEKGSGIHVWNTSGFLLAGNHITQARDGIYIQSSPHGIVRGNRVDDVRYGLHYMFSDDNLFEDNAFSRGAAGTALMYSRRLTFRRNRFVNNRGFASVGLLFKNCDDVVAEDNLIADNARGIFLEGSYRNSFRNNLVMASDTAIVLYDSCGGVRFEGNAFEGNLTPLTLVGRRTDTAFTGNFWSDNDEPDLDGDGRSDLPYRLSNVFDHLRGNLTAADLMALGFAGRVLATAEQAFPVLRAVPVVDDRPLVRAPELAEVPGREGDRGASSVAGIGACVLLLVGGSGGLLAGGQWGRKAAR
ncbi:MAG: nitrous oxide reductase family maturation protein NosD [Acidobacteriota bacterium]